MHESTLKVVGHFACWSHCARAGAASGPQRTREQAVMDMYKLVKVDFETKSYD